MILAVFMVTVSYSALASVVINSTRVIYNESEKGQVVKLSNSGTRPALVQSWLDNGDHTAKPSETKVPFLLTPPITRIDPSKGQSLQVKFLGADLPADRESLYYLNVLDIPSKAQKDVKENVLQLAIRSRIKFFYRPAALDGLAGESYQKVTWQIEQKKVVVSNPTPFYVTVSSITTDKESTKVVSAGQMIAPFSELNFPLSKQANTVYLNIVNDYGSFVTLSNDDKK